MARNDAEIDLSHAGARRKNRPSWVLWGALVVCGTLIGVESLSEPAIRSQVSVGRDWLAGLVASGDDMAMAASGPVGTEASIPPEPRVVPKVSAMPTSRLPIRRGGAMHGR